MKIKVLTTCAVAASLAISAAFAAPASTMSNSSNTATPTTQSSNTATPTTQSSNTANQSSANQSSTSKHTATNHNSTVTKPQYHKTPAKVTSGDVSVKQDGAQAGNPSGITKGTNGSSSGL